MTTEFWIWLIGIWSLQTHLSTVFHAKTATSGTILAVVMAFVSGFAMWLSSFLALFAYNYLALPYPLTQTQMVAIYILTGYIWPRLRYIPEGEKIQVG